MSQVNDENEDETIILEITTVTRVEVPRGTTVINYGRDNESSGFLLPDGTELKSFVVFENGEKDLTFKEMEDLGCYSEDISRKIVKAKT